MPTPEDLRILKEKLTFFDNLTDTQKNLLTSSAKTAHFSKGQAIHCGERDCIGVLIVRSGTIRVFLTSEEGREVTLYRLEDNDICILSASCILDSIDFDVSITAESDCDILQISAAVFAQLSSENMHVQLFSYQLATERFSDVMWAMQQILFMSFDKRLASFLLEEAVKNNSDTIHMTHEQIAKYLGSAREVVSRMLKYFSTEGYVTLARGGITILDKKALSSII